MISSIKYDLSNEGDAFTYIKWHWLFWSIIISYPNSSKAAGKGGTETEQANRDLIIISWTWFQTLVKENPILVIFYFNALIDILLPP